MRIIIFLILALALPGMATAAPYLTCDCTPAVDAVTGFQLQIGAATPIDVVAFTVCESETPCIAPSFRICWDAAQLPAGAYSIKALAKNVWGVSNWTLPLVGAKAGPSSPSSLKVVP